MEMRHHVARGRMLPALLVCAALAGACGGSGGSGPTDPAPAATDPVARITQADLQAAGIPDPATLVEMPTLRAPSPRLTGDFNADGVVDGADFLVWQNAVPLEGSGGFETVVPPADAGGRIVAWVIYALRTEVNSHLAWLEADVALGDDRVPLFYAVADAGDERWEIGGNLRDANWHHRHWGTDGTRDAAATPNFRRSFSQSRNYVWPGGNTYVLVAVGNPGASEASGVTATFDLAWRAIRGGIESEFASGTEGSCAWPFAEGGGIYNPGLDFHYRERGDVYRQDFGRDHTDEAPRMLFAQPMNILIGGTTTDHVTGLGVVDASDYNVWRFGFFDPGEMNPSLYPFTLHVGEGPEDDLNVAPLLDLDTAGTTQGIIGILISAIGPVEGADVALLHAGDEIALTTGQAGVVTIPDLQDGAYDLRVSYTDSRGQAVGLSYQLWVDTTAGTYRIR